MAVIPDRYLDLVDKKTFAPLATIMPDGTPQVTPVWFDPVGDVVRGNTARGRVKARNMKEGAAVALPYARPGEVRVMFEIEPRAAQGMS
jgi:hypothetical protein